MHTITLYADGAELLITVQGSQFFGGAAAMKQARELATLTAALKEAGLEDRDIQLQNAQLEQAGGFGKSSSALYNLKLICKPAERVGDALAVLSHQKNVVLNRTLWTYPEADEVLEAALELAAQKARRRAERLAKAAGVTLASVRIIHYEVGARARLQESLEELEDDVSLISRMDMEYASAAGAPKSRSAAPSPSWSEIGAPTTSHQKTIPVAVTIRYWLSESITPAENPV